MEGIVFAHIGYTNPSKNFDEFQILYNKEVKFLKDKKWHRIPKQVSAQNLISEHPYFKRLVIKQYREYLYQMYSRFNECVKNEEMIKYYFSKNEDIDSVRRKINEIRERIYS